MAPSDHSSVARGNAPVTAKAYMLCAFAAFGGILYGYDSGYINGVLGMAYFKKEFGHAVSKEIDASGTTTSLSITLP